MLNFIANNPVIFIAMLCVLPIVVSSGVVALIDEIKRMREDNDKYKPMKR